VDPERLPEHRPSQMRASHADREQIADILRAAAGDGRLEIDELEERLEQVFSAKTYGELEPIVRDLPAAQAPLPPVGITPSTARAGLPSARIGGTPSGTSAVAIFGGAERRGNWVVPNKFAAVAVFGGVDIDLREARFESQHVEITAVAIFGGIDIKVPDDVVVEVEGAGVFGGFGRPSDTPEPGPGAPRVRINGAAVFGGVDVSYKRPKRRKQLGTRE